MYLILRSLSFNLVIYVVFDVEVVLLSGLLCSWYSDIVAYKVLVYIGLTL